MPSTSVPPRGHARALPPLAIACLLLAGSASAQLAFQSTTLFPNGASRVADVNGDGFPDLFVVSFAAPAVYPGLEGGVFGPIVGSSGPLVSQSYVLGDLDADGRADLVHPHSPPSAALDVRLATLNAVFLPARIVPLPHVPATTYLVDVTGDGAIDLVALPADPGVGRLMLVPGHGDGTFDAALELPASGLLDGHPLSFGDLNGDQLTDIVLNATPGGTKPAPGITALLSHGDGHFAPPITLTTAPHATLSAGDVLGLGRDSVLSADVDGVRVLTLAPHGGSAEILIPAPGVNPADTLLAGQVVAGGPLEIVVATGAHAVLVNDGSGHFTSAPPVVIPGELLLIADADHDGAADLVGSTGIARGQGDGSFEPWYGLPGFTRGLAAADVDGDGHPDVITTFAEVAPAQIRHGRLDGSLGPPSILDVGPSPLDVRLLDVAGSAHVDALTLNVVPSSESGPSVLAVCAGHDDGSFAPPVLTPVGDAQGMDVADFDDDGLPDVLLWPETLVLRNAGGGSWLASSVPASLAVLAACAGDFNGDGHVDILRLLKQPANIVLRQVLLGHGDGTFEPLAIESSGAFGSISALSGVQLDADGQLDLVVTLHQGQWLAQSSGFIVAFPGHGDGTFGQGVGLAPADAGPSLFTDLDGDGDVDLLSSGLDVTEGSAAGLTSHVIDSPAPWPADHFALADFDGDGIADVAATSIIGNALMIFRRDPGVWQSLHHSLAGPAGYSKLQGVGSLQPGSVAHLLVTHAPPAAPLLLVLGLRAGNLPLHGGLLVPSPDVIVTGLLTDGAGASSQAAPWPAAVPAGTTLYAQAWFPSGGGHFASTNAVAGTAQP